MPDLVSKDGWRSHRFDDIAMMVNDRIDDPTKADVEHYVGLEHLESDSLTIRRWGSPSDVEATKLRFRAGDIIFGRRRVYQRKLAVAEFDGICSAHAMVLRAKASVALPEFLPFFMQSDVFMERAKEISVGSLSPTINWKTLAKEVFVLPPLAQQGQIQRVLSRSRTALETLRTSSSRLLDLRRSMQNELLFRSPRSGHGRTVLLSELAQIDPSDRPLEEDAPFVPMDAVTEWQRTIDRFEQRGSRAGARASAGDVLMARITPCLENGKIAQVPDNVSRCGGSTEFIVLRALPETDRSYLYWLISSDRIRNAAVAMMSGSTGRQRVSGADIGGVRVPQIDSAKQIELGRLIDSVDEDRKALLVRVEEAAQFNSGMVNTMIGGRGS